MRFVQISQDGEVHRCNETGPSMGNLLHGTARFADAPSPCDTHYCVYFCMKYSALPVKAKGVPREAQAALAV
jgi:hypothetical protein